MHRPAIPGGPRGVADVRAGRDQRETTRQHEAVHCWAARNGLSNGLVFGDTGSFDLSAERADFQRLLRAVEAGLVDRVVVDSQDRFGSRDAHEWGKFLTLLHDHGCGPCGPSPRGSPPRPTTRPS